MNNWWDYLEHGQEGQERKGHKYYARIITGTDKHGRIQYRYFYDAREYGAYKTQKQQADKNRKVFSEESVQKKTKGRTNIITGWGNTGLPSKSDMNAVKKQKPTRLRNGASSLRDNVNGIEREITSYFGNHSAVNRTSIRTISVKTVKNKKSKKGGKSVYQRGKDLVAKFLKCDAK